MFRFFLCLEFLQGMVYHGQWVCYIYRLLRDWSGFKTTLICGSRYKTTESHSPFSDCWRYDLCLLKKWEMWRSKIAIYPYGKIARLKNHRCILILFFMCQKCRAIPCFQLRYITKSLWKHKSRYFSKALVGDNKNYCYQAPLSMFFSCENTPENVEHLPLQLPVSWNNSVLTRNGQPFPRRRSYFWTKSSLAKINLFDEFHWT